MWISKWLLPFALNAFVVIATATAADIKTDNINVCIAADHYHNSAADYEICNNALKRPNISDKVKSELLLGRGEASYFMNHMGLAIVDLDEAVKLNPDNDKARLRRAWTLYQFNQNELALEDINKIIAKNPDEVNALFAFGFIYSGTKDWQSKTLPTYKHILEIDPDHYLTRFNLGGIYLDTYDDPSQALMQYSLILKASDAELSKVKSFPAKDAKNYAFKDLVRRWRVVALLRSKQYPELIDDLNLLIKSYPEMSDPLTLRSKYFKHLEKWNDELADAQAALKLNKSDSEAFESALSAFYHLNQFNEGLAFGNSLFWWPCRCGYEGTIYHWRAVFNQKLHHTEEALRDYEHAINSDPDILPQIMTMIIQSNYYTGKISDPFTENVRNSLTACIVDPECLK